jgi:hypothetical protein
MRKRIWTGMVTAMAACATVAITAQQPPPQPPSSSANADKKITVTGCLKEAPATSPATPPAGAAGTTGTAGAAGATGTSGAADAPKFVLTNAAPSTGDPAATTPPPEPTPGAAKASATTYRLIANATSLSPHVGKKLELTGTLEEPGAAPQSPQPSAAEGTMAALRVESGKVLAASCSE